MSQPSSSDNGDDTSESSATAFVLEKATPEYLDFHRNLIMRAVDEREKLVRSKKVYAFGRRWRYVLMYKVGKGMETLTCSEKEVGERWGVVRPVEISTCLKNDCL
jgi:hypothetical protein